MRTGASVVTVSEGATVGFHNESMLHRVKELSVGPLRGQAGLCDLLHFGQGDVGMWISVDAHPCYRSNDHMHDWGKKEEGREGRIVSFDPTTRLHTVCLGRRGDDPKDESLDLTTAMWEPLGPCQLLGFDGGDAGLRLQLRQDFERPGGRSTIPTWVDAEIVSYDPTTRKHTLQTVSDTAVSYTHLTLPTKRIV
eukprot:TRINITY_DN11591_c0_g1_i1.p2 TRINITY_DN11591_c0_g1~~TRINITY_DN11591_c0_g1_i1.p2  ORF type:complete len:194 (-),score=17.32 TRINITY_DN11591_c0_g1_i1:66-647(-)